MFSVVEFKECDGGGVALINSQWLTPRKKEVFWPPIKDTNKFNKLLKQSEQNIDTEKWSTYEVQRIFYETDVFERGAEKLRQCMTTSDIQTDLEQDYENIAKKRHRARPLRFDSSDSEEEIQTKKRSHGAIRKPPKFDFLSTADSGSGTSQYHLKSTDTPKTSNSQFFNCPSLNDERTPNLVEVIGNSASLSVSSQNS